MTNNYYQKHKERLRNEIRERQRVITGPRKISEFY